MPTARVAGSNVDAAATRPLIRKVPADVPSTRIPTIIATSPILVTMNDFTAAERDPSSSQWCPISRYETRPMTSQPTISTSRSSATTTSIIAAVNSEISAVYEE